MDLPPPHKMGLPSLLFLAILAVWSVDHGISSNLHLSRDIKIFRTRGFPCSGLEIGRRTHDVEAASIIILEISMAVDPEAEYNAVYGQSAHQASTHSQHFQCFKGYAETLGAVKRRMFESLAEAMEFKSETQPVD